jgi:anhydro-N-acetylmuramic acid kinase
MSGTSLDGVDVALTEISDEAVRLLAHHYLPYPDELRQQLLSLHHSGNDELHRAAVAANQLAQLYARGIEETLLTSRLKASDINAIGCHGQTVRHRPDAHYTLQIGNAALLAEMTGITVVADFRSRDIAAGGQGAPLVPAFHAKALASPTIHRVIANIGGIANLTDLPVNGPVRGFDCGPGNLLMDAWMQKCLNRHHDEAGQWAASGQVLVDLLGKLKAHPFIAANPPKSAGREQFNLHWLELLLDGRESDQDVQATLLEFTARSLVEAAQRHCAGYQEMYLCGGGVHNQALVTRIAELSGDVHVASTDELGIDPDWMEAIAFAWLARQCLHGQPANLPEVTGAKGPRILGAIYPA